MLQVSKVLFLTAFLGYLAASILYIIHFTAWRWHRAAAKLTIGDGGGGSAVSPIQGLAGLATLLLGLAVLGQGTGILFRWLGSGQAPLSNMFEYMAFLGWSIMLAFLLINAIYRMPLLGAFVAPLGVIIVGYASLFPQEVQPLVPALQSYWLVLHVAFAALGEGLFALSFVTAVLYLLRVRGKADDSRSESILEMLLFCGMILAGFIAANLMANLVGYRVDVPFAARPYSLPPLVAPTGVPIGSLDRFMGMELPLFTLPAWMEGAEAARIVNTLICALLIGLVLNGLIRLLTRRSLRELGSGMVRSMDPQVLDEISYRGIAIGFPLFTLGAMLFAMIWAQKAWGSYWSWDPKETWSLITWLFYSGYLHLRIARGWEGRPAAWTAAIGFVVTLFTLVGVNLLLSGLHTYG